MGLGMTTYPGGIASPSVEAVAIGSGTPSEFRGAAFFLGFLMADFPVFPSGRPQDVVLLESSELPLVTLEFPRLSNPEEA